MRAARPADLEAVLRSTGFHPYPGGKVAARADTELPDPCAADAADRRLATLVADAAHDPLAARIVLQRLLPGLLAIARRRGRSEAALTLHLYQELLGNAWVVIRCYPIDRRPHRVAANLLRDVEYQTFTRQTRLRRVRTEPWDATTWDDQRAVGAHQQSGDQRHPFEEVVELLSEARAEGMRPERIQLAAALASGRALHELVEGSGITVRALRYRRKQVVAELQSLLRRSMADEGP